jgi:TP901 family phage tail tape measure protein
MAEQDEYEFIARFRVEALEAARQAEQALKGMGDEADNAAEQLMTTEEAMQEAAKAAAEIVTAFIAVKNAMRLALAGLGEFSDFETRMVAVAKVTDLTAQQVVALGSRFEDLAADLGLPIEMFTEVATVAGQLGVQGVQDITTFTEAIVQLGGASDLVGAEGATILARMLTITGENISEAGTLASVLVELGNNVAATEREIARVASEIARSTASFGTSTTFAAGLGAAMAELGLRAETAGTSVGRIFAEMGLAASKGGDDAKVWADAMGLTVAQFQAMQENDPTETFKAFIEQLNRVGESDALLVLDSLGLANAETLKTITPLITNYDRLVHVMEMAREEALNPDALQTEAMVAQATLAREYAGLIEALRNELRELGEVWSPIAAEMIALAREAVEAFNDLPEEVQHLVQVLATVIPVLLSVRLIISALGRVINLLAFSGLISGFAGVTAGAGTAATAIGVLRAAMALIGGPIGVAVLALTGLVMLIPSSKELIGDLEDVSMGASGAMDAFSEATARARQEQEDLGGAVTMATARILEQSRIELQESLRALYTARDDVANDLDGSGLFNLSELGVAADKLQFQVGSRSLGGSELNAIGAMIQEVEDGTRSIGDMAKEVEQYLKFGGSFERLYADLNEANSRFVAGDGPLSDVDEAEAALLGLAASLGDYQDELREIQDIDPIGQDAARRITLIRELVEEMRVGSTVGATLRDVLDETFIDAMRSAANAEVQIQALEAALDGNLETAAELLGLPNPFQPMEDGAANAREEIASLLSEVRDVLGLTAQLGDFNIQTAGGYEAFYAMNGGSQEEEIVRQTVRLAERLGVSPQDLLTIFSFETGGTLNPDERGEITPEWGRHQGLIQFGEPQARQHGYQPGQSVADQFTAIESYFKSVGIQPGDNLLTLYASVNAGSRTAIHASDENNGGTPGSVYDKVNDQMDGHRNRATGLLSAYGGVVTTEREQIAANARLVADAEDAITRSLEERLRADKDAADARRDLLEANSEVLEDYEFELSLIGKTVEEQTRLRYAYDALNQAKQEGIDVDAEVTASGRTYRAEIEATANALGELASQEEERQGAMEAAKERQEFYNQIQQDFNNGIIDGILEGENLIDTLGGIAKAFARAALEAALFGEGPLTGLFGGSGGGLIGGLFSAIMPGAGAATGTTTVSAKGNVVYQSMTIPLAKGGQNLIGEAGAEAIMPLDRTADGTLGVRMVGGAPGAGGLYVDYHPTFILQSDGSVSGGSGGGDGDKDQERLLKALDSAVHEKVLEVLQAEARNGGMFNPASKPYG